MKVLSTIILASILFAFFLPLSSSAPHSESPEASSIFTLDVCHCSASDTLNNVQVPFIYSSQCELALPRSPDDYETIPAPFNPFLFALQIEQPPRIQS